MQFYTSYFYMVRFMQPNDIAFSTAVWDPKWFHDFKGQNHRFIDKNGVANGLRAPFFAPDENSCFLCQGSRNCTETPDECLFMERYSEQIHKLDCYETLSKLKKGAERVARDINVAEDLNVILLFHEAPSNKCSEREVLTAWFAEYGIKIQEYGITNNQLSF